MLVCWVVGWLQFLYYYHQVCQPLQYITIYITCMHTTFTIVNSLCRDIFTMWLALHYTKQCRRWYSWTSMYNYSGAILSWLKRRFTQETPRLMSLNKQSGPYASKRVFLHNFTIRISKELDNWQSDLYILTYVAERSLINVLFKPEFPKLERPSLSAPLLYTIISNTYVAHIFTLCFQIRSPGSHEYTANMQGFCCLRDLN